MNSKKDLSYYLTLFKVEGHETWRASLSSDKNGFERESKNNNWPKVTAKQTLRIDRITGGFVVEK